MRPVIARFVIVPIKLQYGFNPLFVLQDCKIHHSAREGDLWSESRYMGFRSKYYACMEGAVYDITEWANCQVCDGCSSLKASFDLTIFQTLGRTFTSFAIEFS